MTKDESIALAIKLHRGYEETERLENQINKNRIMSTQLAASMPTHYSAFRYFLPFLLASFITILVSIIPAVFVISIAAFLDQANRNNSNAYVPYVVVLIIAAIFAMIHLIGGFVARNKSRYMNNLETERVAGDIRKSKRLIRENEELIAQLDTELTKLSEYDDIVPAKFRNSMKMSEVKKILMSGKAENFTDAINMLTM